jgi:hypothetical protein
MAKKVTFLFILFLLFIILTTAEGCTHYLSTTGSDGNAGTSVAQAWGNLSYACNQIDAGNTLCIIDDGIFYNHSCVLANTGNATHPVVITAYNGTPTIDGWNTKTQCIDVDNCNYLTVSDLVLLNGSTDGISVTDSSHVTVDNVTAGLVGNVGILIGNTNNSIVKDSTVYNCDMDGIRVGGTSTFNVTVDNCDSFVYDGLGEYNDYGMGIIAGATDVTFKDCRVTGEATKEFSHGIAITSGGTSYYPHDNLIENCTVEYGHFNFNFRDFAYNNTIKDCTAIGHHMSSEYGFYLHGGCYNFTFDGCVAYNLPQGFRLRPEVGPEHNNTIINCIAYNTTAYGILADAEHSSVISCTVFGNAKTTTEGIWVRKNATVKNCIITGCVRGIRGDGTGDQTVTYTNSWNNTYYSSPNFYQVTKGTGCNETDPLFYDKYNWDFHLNSTTGTWAGTGWEAMSANSPCIDAGDPYSTVLYEPSPNGNRINMGAYGNTVEASKGGSTEAFVNPVWVLASGAFVLAAGWLAKRWGNRRRKRQ